MLWVEVPILRIWNCVETLSEVEMQKSEGGGCLRETRSSAWEPNSRTSHGKRLDNPRKLQWHPGCQQEAALHAPIRLKGLPPTRWSNGLTINKKERGGRSHRGRVNKYWNSQKLSLELHVKSLKNKK